MRVTKQSKYQKEREDICLKLISILEIDTDGCFLLNELDSNIEKQNKILDMKDEIQKYFAVSSITAFKPNVSSETKRPYLNIARAILRQEGYLFEGKDHWKKHDNGLLERTIKYTIFRKN